MQLQKEFLAPSWATTGRFGFSVMRCLLVLTVVVVCYTLLCFGYLHIFIFEDSCFLHLICLWAERMTIVWKIWECVSNLFPWNNAQKHEKQNISGQSITFDPTRKILLEPTYWTEHITEWTYIRENAYCFLNQLIIKNALGVLQYGRWYEGRIEQAFSFFWNPCCECLSDSVGCNPAYAFQQLTSPKLPRSPEFSLWTRRCHWGSVVQALNKSVAAMLFWYLPFPQNHF